MARQRKRNYGQGFLDIYKTRGMTPEKRVLIAWASRAPARTMGFTRYFTVDAQNAKLRVDRRVDRVRPCFVPAEQSIDEPNLSLSSQKTKRM